VAALIVLALAFAAAGCGGSGSSSASEDEFEMADAQTFADGFVQRLVVRGKWSAISDDVPPLVAREVRRFQRDLVDDNVRQVLGRGQLRTDCEPNVTLGTGDECFLYRLRGDQIEPVSGERHIVRGQLRIWFRPDDDSWELSNYSYDATVDGKR
jgi:hypothetical protein